MNTSTVRAISLWQPFASLWLSPWKIHETRHWATSYRGRLIVHAAKRECDYSATRELDDLCNKQFGSRWRDNLPRGKLIGSLNISDCISTNFAHSDTIEDGVCGDFGPNRFMWRRAEDYQGFKKPIPYVGRQGFFNVPIELLVELPT